MLSMLLMVLIPGLPPGDVGRTPAGAMPVVLQPVGEIPAERARFAGAWGGSVRGLRQLVVYRVESDGAYVYADFGPQGGYLPCHVWAKASFTGAKPPVLTWSTEWASFSCWMGEEGNLLRGEWIETRTEGQGASRSWSLNRIPAPSRAAASVPPPKAGLALKKLLRDLEGDQKPAARLEAFLEDVIRRGVPCIEPGSRPGLSCATFLYRGKAAEVALMGDMNGFSRCKDYFAAVPGTDLFWFSAEYPSDARLEYLLVRDGQVILDPLNHRTSDYGRGRNSEVWMADYKPPGDLEPLPQELRGTWEEILLESRFPGKSRKAFVYLPLGYAQGAARYPVLYMNDAQGALAFGSVAAILDHAIAQRKVRPLIAVLLPFTGKRMEEYGLNPQFEDFMAEEAVPAIDRRFRTISAPEARAVSGISASATASLALAVRRSQVFGMCMAQSPAAKVGDLLDLLRQGPSRPLKAYVDVGRFESDFSGSDLLSASREIRDRLLAHGCEVQLREVEEGHGWKNWRARMGAGLSFLFGPPSPDLPHGLQDK